jgi:hypothetical protein
MCVKMPEPGIHFVKVMCAATFERVACYGVKVRLRTLVNVVM